MKGTKVNKTITMTMPEAYHQALRLLAVYDGKKNVSEEVRGLVDEKAEKHPDIAKLLKRK